MTTIAQYVEKLVNERPLVYEAVAQGIVSFSNLAAKLQPEIEKELNKPVKHSAVVMALRRYAEKITKIRKTPTFDYTSEIIMKTDLCDIAVSKSQTVNAKIKRLHNIVDYAKGDVLNVINGNYAVSIITNMKYMDIFKKELKGEKIMKIEGNLVSLSLAYSEKFLYTPGVISTIIRKLTWENVNIFELVSTFTELSFIIAKKDAVKGYQALESLMRK